MTRLSAIAFLLAATLPISAAELQIEKGEVKFAADTKDGGVPEFFRMDARTFAYELKPKYSLPNAGVDVSTLTFPSAVKSPIASNNTVYAEYYKPRSAGKHPTVIVLDILDGAQVVARSQALWLAQHDIAALVVVMAHYGPRREPGSKERLLSTDIEKSVANVRQTVLDCRLALAWLETRPECDAKNFGVLGTSLGSFVGGIFGGAEPKVRSVNLLLGGGALVESFSEHPIAVVLAPIFRLAGVTPEKLKKLIDPIDPITYADGLKGKRLLLIAAKNDDVVPPSAMKRLWEAVGKPEAMIWVEATHVGSALYTFQMMRAVIKNAKGE
jgi:dienelactone hydrolase